MPIIEISKDLWFETIYFNKTNVSGGSRLTTNFDVEKAGHLVGWSVSLDAPSQVAIQVGVSLTLRNGTQVSYGILIDNEANPSRLRLVRTNDGNPNRNIGAMLMLFFKK